MTLSSSRDATPVPAGEESLHEVHERFEAAFGGLLIGIGLLSAREGSLGRFLRANRALCQILGYTEEELRERDLQSLTHPDDADATLFCMEQMAQGLIGSFQSEKRQVHADGHVVHVDLSATALSDDDGRTSWLLVQVDDVTERKRSEEAARRSTELLRLLEVVAEAANQARRPEEALQTALDQICAYTGWPVGHVHVLSEEEAGDAVSSGIWHVDDPGRYEELRLATSATRVGAGVDLPGRVLDSGEPVWVPDVSSQVDVAGEPEGDVGVRSAFAFPVLVGSEVAAVIEFFSAEEAEPDEELLDAMSQIGVQLGRVMERHRAEAALRASEEHSRRIVETANDAFVGMDASGRITEWNSQAEATFGWTAAEAIGRSMAETIIPERYRELHRRGLEHFLATGEGPVLQRRVELSALRRDGEEFPVELSIWATESDGDDAPYFNAFIRDVTEQKRAHEQLTKERELRDAVLDSLEEAIVVCDEEGNLTLSNRAAREFYGLPETAGNPETWGKSYELSHPDGTSLDRDEIPLLRALDGERVRSLELLLRANGGERRAVVVNGQPMFDVTGRKLGAVVAMHDISAQRAAEEDLAHSVMHDPVTGLPNRTLFLDRLSQALERNARGRRSPGRSVGVLFVDVDRFRAVNEDFGHEAADQLLVVLARRLQAAMRPADTAARLGDDEFGVVVEDVVGERGAEELASRVHAAMSGRTELESGELSVTVSIGVVIAADESRRPEELVRDAEATMWRARERGGDRFEFFEEEIRVAALRRAETERALRRAVDNEELSLVYQPEMSLDSDRIMGVEALLRWEHPDLGTVSPMDFVPLAEETGLIVPIGNWVIEEGCRQWARWRAELTDHPPPLMSVNVSGRQFDERLVAGVRSALEEADMDPAALCLEVTESAVMDDVEAAIGILGELKSLGVKLALDDFGTGYSSLAYLKRLPLDIVKIDRAFVAGLGRDLEDTAIVAAVMGMAHALDLSVVAEGVETESQLAGLRRMGCEYAQGYYFARPEPAEAIAEMLTGVRTAWPSPPSTALDGERPAAASTRADRVIVAAEPSDVVQLAAMSLATAGFEVHRASTGAEALAMAGVMEPDCVVIDVQLPDRSGFGVCRALRLEASTADCTIVMLATHAEAADKVRAFSVGADDYIVKPVAPRDLVSRVRAAVRRRRELS